MDMPWNVWKILGALWVLIILLPLFSDIGEVQPAYIWDIKHAVFGLAFVFVTMFLDFRIGKNW